MKSSELFHITFSRGCGISLAQARESERYGEVLAASDHLPEPELAATAQFLGESLIEAAAQMLPPSVLDIVRAWPEASAHGQLILLEIADQELTSSCWHQQHNVKPSRAEKRQVASAVLPLEHGVYPESPIQPSCIGMATLLMAFAKLLGAPHYYAHVLMNRDRAIDEQYLALNRYILNSLEKELPTMAAAGEFTPIKKRVGTASLQVVETAWYTFHGSLLIQIKDGRWVLVDPYLQVRSILDPDDWSLPDALASMAEGHFGRVASISSIKMLKDLRERWIREETSLGALVEAFEHGWEDKPYDRDRVVSAAQIVERAPEHSLLAWLGDLFDPEWDLYSLVVFGLFDWRRKRRPTDREIEKLLQELNENPDYVRLVTERILAIGYREWVNRTRQDIAQLRRQMAHVSLELNDPALGVAVSVMNNVRCFLGPKPRAVNGFLARLTDSQVIWHDTMCEVRHRCRLDAITAQRLMAVEAGLRSLPKRELHPMVRQLLAALDEERRTPDGQTTECESGSNGRTHPDG